MDQRVIYRPNGLIVNPLKSHQKTQRKYDSESFANHLKTSMENADKGIKISKHAEQRIQQRNLQITEQQWNQLENKLIEARQKGLNDSLVLMDQAALIVNAKNNTVITAMGRAEAGEQIFTNINGAIILE